MANTSDETIGDVTINPFDLATISKNPEAHPVIVIIGPRNTGKTTLLRWLLYHNRKKYVLPVVVSKTADASGCFRDNIPDIVIHKKYDRTAIGEFIKYQERLKYLKKKGVKPYDTMNIDAILVMDDILADLDWSKDENVRDLIFNGRHYNTTVIITLQDPMAIPRKFRGQIDYIFCFGAEQDAEKKRIYDYYWNSSFGNRHLFNNIFDETTIDYRCMVIDNFNKKEKTLSKRIMFCKTETVEKLPRHRIGSDELWHEHDKQYENNWFEKSTQLENSLIKKKNSRGKVILGQSSRPRSEHG